MGSRGRLQEVLAGANPLEVANRGVPAGYRTVRLGEVAARAENSAMTDWKSLGLPSAKELTRREGMPRMPALLPGADDADAALHQIRSTLGVAAGDSVEIQTPVGPRSIDDAWLPHVVEKREAARERYAHLIWPTLEAPTEVWRADYNGEQRERFMKFWRDGDKAMLAVVNLQKGGVFWNFIPMPLRSVDKQRVGALLWKKYQ